MGRHSAPEEQGGAARVVIRIPRPDPVTTPLDIRERPVDTYGRHAR